jgi:hypothetical protein
MDAITLINTLFIGFIVVLFISLSAAGLLGRDASGLHN